MDSIQLKRYRILNRIGKGAFGQVHKAIDIQTSALVALKIIRISQQEFKSFQKQISMLKSLHHPQIITLIDYKTHQHFAQMVLQYIQGGSLLNLIQKEGLPEKLVANFIHKILKGLIYLHSLNIAHRDLKAANILLCKDGNIKLADFGIAKNLNKEPVCQTAKGSPYWMAPQIIKLNQVTTKCDIWALGCTIIQLVTGKCPYSELLPYPAMVRIVQDQHPPFPKLSINGIEFLQKCLQKDPILRSSAQQLIKHPWISQQRKQQRLDRQLRLLTNLLRHKQNKQQTQKQLLQILNICQQQRLYFYKIQQFYQFLNGIQQNDNQLAHLYIDLATTQLFQQSIDILLASLTINKVLSFTHKSNHYKTISSSAYFINQLACINIKKLIASTPYEAIGDLLDLQFGMMRCEVLIGIQVLEKIVRQIQREEINYIGNIGKLYDYGNKLMIILQQLIKKQKIQIYQYILNREQQKLNRNKTLKEGCFIKNYIRKFANTNNSNKKHCTYSKSIIIKTSTINASILYPLLSQYENISFTFNYFKLY